MTYALNTFGLSFATISSLFVWLFLEKRHSIMNAYYTSQIPTMFGHKSTGRENLQPAYKTVPLWWYGVATVLALGLGIFACEYYPVQLRWYGVLLSFAVSAVFFLPVSHASSPARIYRDIEVLMEYSFLQLAWVYATTNMKIQIDIFCRIIAGYIWEGKVLANIWFFNLGYISGIKGLAFAQDLKLGIYCNVSPAPPNLLFYRVVLASSAG